MATRRTASVDWAPPVVRRAPTRWTARVSARGCVADSCAPARKQYSYSLGFSPNNRMRSSGEWWWRVRPNTDILLCGANVLNAPKINLKHINLTIDLIDKLTKLIFENVINCWKTSIIYNNHWESSTTKISFVSSPLKYSIEISILVNTKFAG